VTSAERTARIVPAPGAAGHRVDWTVAGGTPRDQPDATSSRRVARGALLLARQIEEE